MLLTVESFIIFYILFDQASNVEHHIAGQPSSIKDFVACHEDHIASVEQKNRHELTTHLIW